MSVEQSKGGTGLVPRCRARIVAVLLIAATLSIALTGCSSCSAPSGDTTGSSVGTSSLPAPLVRLGEGASVSDEGQARTVALDTLAAAGFSEGSVQLGDVDVEDALGKTYYRFEQTYEGIPVWGRAAIVGAGGVLSGNVASLEGVAIDMVPAIDEGAALDAVANACGGDAATMGLGTVVYSLGDEDPVLAYRVLVLSDGFVGYAFVSAKDGSVVGKAPCLMQDANGTTVSVDMASGSPDSLAAENAEDASGIDEVFSWGTDIYGSVAMFRVEPFGSDVVMRDSVNNMAVYDAQGDSRTVIVGYIELYGEGGTTYWLLRNPSGGGYLFFDEDGSQVRIETDAETGERFALAPDGSGDRIVSSGFGYEGNLVRPVGAKEVDGSVQWEWDCPRAVTLAGSLGFIQQKFYLGLLGRDGFDGEGGPVHAVVNVGENNAFAWCPTGDFAQIATGDGDEYVRIDVVGHEYTHAVVNAIAGFTHTGENDALGEALSDIFAVLMVDLADDGSMNNSGTWSNGWRDFADPAASAEREENDRTEHPSVYRGEYWCEPTEDETYEHSNSTVVSHAAYLMCCGDGEGTALTTGELAELLYSALFMLSPDCDFGEFASCVADRADAMLGEPQAQRVRYAFGQVGLDVEPVLVVRPDADGGDRVGEEAGPTVAAAGDKVPADDESMKITVTRGSGEEAAPDAEMPEGGWPSKEALAREVTRVELGIINGGLTEGSVRAGVDGILALLPPGALRALIEREGSYEDSLENVLGMNGVSQVRGYLDDLKIDATFSCGEALDQSELQEINGAFSALGLDLVAREGYHLSLRETVTALRPVGRMAAGESTSVDISDSGAMAVRIGIAWYLWIDVPL